MRYHYFIDLCAMLPIVYFNGAYLPQEAAKLGIADLSILRGYGVFDYFRYVEGRPRFLMDHLDRFFHSAALLGLYGSIDKAALAEVVQQLIDRNGEANGGIRFVMTGGYSPDAYEISSPNLMAMAYPFALPAAEMFQKGCNVLLHPYERQLPGAKTIDYLEGIRILPLLREKKADYPLYVDRDGFVRESDRSNFFIVKEGYLITPKDDILLGITRKHLLLLAQQLGIPTLERAVSVEELQTADEAIIASSTKGAMPITRVDGQPIRDGQVGPLTQQLMAAWPAYYEQA